VQASFTDAQAKAAVVRRSVNGVANKVGKNLAQFAGKSMDGKRRPFL
jgi:hypothetical protein